MFFIPALNAASEAARPNRAGVGAGIGWAWLGVWLAMTLVVGLRFEVGGDWGNYLRQFDALDASSAWEDLLLADPGYRALEWLAASVGWSIVGVNFLGGAIFSYGLTVFCRSLPRPWLALAVAVPYLVVVVAMGYTRQGIALGCAMAGLVVLTRQRHLRFIAWIFLAASFHKSAILLLPIAAFAAVKRRLWVALLVGVTLAVGYVLFLAESLESLMVNYIEAQYQSEGALVRLAMSGVAGAIMLLLGSRFAMSGLERKLWRWMGVASVALFAAYFVSASSTAVDRLGLYMLPLQLVVFAHLPQAMGFARSLWVWMVLVFYASVMFVWLHFATHADAWIPYRFYPLELLFGG